MLNWRLKKSNTKRWLYQQNASWKSQEVRTGHSVSVSDLLWKPISGVDYLACTWRFQKPGLQNPPHNSYGQLPWFIYTFPGFGSGSFACVRRKTEADHPDSWKRELANCNMKIANGVNLTNPRSSHTFVIRVRGAP
jgi:hypothetical protein